MAKEPITKLATGTGRRASSGPNFRTAEVWCSFCVLPPPQMKRNPGRLRRERKTITTMIGLYCRQQHASAGQLCAECAALADYAAQRLEKCPFGDEKPTCAQCPIHCYKPACRARVQEVMRFAGPRLLLRRPVLTIRHLLDERKNPPELPSRQNRKQAGRKR
jgi:hypothetical protein